MNPRDQIIAEARRHAEEVLVDAEADIAQAAGRIAHLKQSLSNEVAASVLTRCGGDVKAALRQLASMDLLAGRRV